MGFKWIQSSLNMAWPRNYVDAIMELCGQVDLILVSSHPEVITELLNRGVDVTLVYPDETQKKEYHQRHLNRGDPQWLVDFFADNFDLFIVAARNQPGSRDIVLQPGQHLTDVISRIIKT
jgi:hypothetical protein